MPVRSNPLPPVDVLAAKFDYHPATGILISKSKERRGLIISKRDSNGYIQVRIGRHHYLAQRVIWKLMTGRDPVAQIDHRDCDRVNNRWSNLREASKSRNAHNVKRARPNKHGFKGVSRSRRGRFVARIKDDGRDIHLGAFDTAAEAHAAYATAARERFRDFARPE